MGQQDPYAAIAKPLDDPYAPIAKPASPSAPGTDSQRGFFSSVGESSGFNGLLGAIAHPYDTVKGIPGAIAGEGRRIAGELGQGVEDYKKNGLSETTRRDFGRAVPVIGPALAQAQAQHDAGNNLGMAGTLAGTIAGFAAPQAAGKVLGTAGRGVGAGLRVASADAPSLSLAATRALTTGTPGELLQSALKPGVKYGAGVGDSLEKALPDVLAANPSLNGVSGFASAADAAKDASFEPYNNLIAPYRPLKSGVEGPVRPSRIDGTPIADAQLKSIPTMDLIEKPGTKTFPDANGVVGGGILNDTAAKAAPYRAGFDVPTLDAVRGDANAKLNAFYNKAGGDQAAALSNPETARVKAVGDTTRKILYPELESGAGLPSGAVADMQGKYGLLSDVSDIANKREPVFARHDPVTLSQKIVSGHGNPLSMAWNYAVQKGLGNLTDSDALVNSAIDRFENPEGTPLVARPGFVPQTAMKLGKRLGGK
jgi:hypothetical protein